MTGKVSEYVARLVLERCEKHRVLVWFDEERTFEGLLRTLTNPRLKLINAGQSELAARRQADEAFEALPAIPGDLEVGGILVYVPRSRATKEEDAIADPFEGYARIGAAFGDDEAEKLESLARRAMPLLAGEIRRLFVAGKPSLRTLDGLEMGSRYPLVGEALRTEDPLEVARKVIASTTARQRLDATPGSWQDAWRMLAAAFGSVVDELGGEPSADGPARFARLVLFSEFASEMHDLPSGFESVPRLTDIGLELAKDLCRRLRDSREDSDIYLEIARDAEVALGLASIPADHWTIRATWTFPIECSRALEVFIAAALAGAAPPSRALEGRRDQIWEGLPELSLEWKVAERCAQLEAAATSVEQSSVTMKAGVRGAFEFYTAEGWRLEHQQRLMEQSVAEAAQPTRVAELVGHARRRYRDIALRLQAQFLKVVSDEGWPPPDVLRQTQVFARFVQPTLEQGERVAYFLVDALRFEMAHDIAMSFGDNAEIELLGAASVVPTTTPCGMAALMPGADGTFALTEAGEGLEPAVQGIPLPGVDERRSLMRLKFGDLVSDLVFQDVLLANSDTLKRAIGDSKLIVVRTQEIDAQGEGPSLVLPLKGFSQTLLEIRQAATKLARLGVSRVVLSADHGFVLLPEVLPGDVVPVPSGSWRLTKRRCRIGKAATMTADTTSFPAAHLGLGNLDADVVVPKGFGVFSGGSEYFHEGLSLPECVVPVLSISVGVPKETAGIANVELTYKSSRFTSRIIGLRARLSTLSADRVLVRLEAFDGPGQNSHRVGLAADCDARDEATGLIALRRGVETQVPVVIDHDFSGSDVEIRVLDQETGATLGRLRLKSALME